MLEEADWPQVEALFAEVFGHALPRPLTAWKYAPGRGLSIGMSAGRATNDSAVDRASGPDRELGLEGSEGSDSGSPLLAHCGLVFREVLAFGRPIQAAQLVDLMVAPSARGRLLRQASPFAQVVGHALAQLGTERNPRNPDRVAFGFPSQRAMRLAEHLGLVREIDQVHELSWSPLPGPLPQALDGDDADLLPVVDALWHHMRLSLADALVGVRDASHLVQRFVRHPTLRYGLHLVRSDAGAPQGVLVVRREGDRLELTDWIAPLALVPRVLQAARALAAAESAAVLVSWMTSGFVDRLAADALAQRPTEFRIICRADLPDALRQRQQQRWWLTAGDTDYR